MFTSSYLGHILDQHLSDNDDVLWEISNMFVGTNVRCRKFSRCFINMKIKLFKSYCMCLYGTALWCCYKIGTMNKLKSAYNRCLKIFFGCSQLFSVMQLLQELGLHSWEMLIINCQSVFVKSWHICENRLISHLCMLGL